MNWQEYQEFCKTTAIYPREGKPYPLLGLLGEIGEVCEKLKKQIRDKVDLREGIFKELGDCIWYITAWATDHGFRLSDLYVESWDYAKATAEDTVLELMFQAAWLAKLETELGIQAVLLTWVSLVQQLGFTVEEVTAANRAKLSDRKDRGVLGGSGDNR
jgi:hypothetical protein